MGFASIGTAASTAQDFSEMSIEDLMNIEITSVSKKSQRLSETAAAVFVIDQEDIRRSGATSIPELLRMAPGVQVAQIDANKWAITARGSNGAYATKLLVMIDGRSVYSPQFSGVYWNAQDTMLEDIERIEIIRGPGATVWGANAVNGVINIITKDAADTIGGLLTTSLGTEIGSGAIRYGSRIGQDTFWRIYTKASDYDSHVYANGDDANDNWRSLRGGFRMDSRKGSEHKFTLQGDLYDNDFNDAMIITDQTMTPPFISESIVNNENNGSGGNVLGKWNRHISDASEYSLQVYYDRVNYDPGYLETSVDTVDVDFQHRFQWTDHQEIIWGLGYRFQHDEAKNGASFITFVPQTDSYSLWSMFVQDEIRFYDDQLRLTLGSKFEYNDFTGFEFQPSVRMLWQPDRDQTLWASISRAVRTPSRGERYASLTQPVPGRGPTTLLTHGNPDYDSEELIAYEVGYRIQATSTLNFDTTAYFNDYDNLRWGAMTGIEPGFPPDPTLIHSSTINGLEGYVYGFELASGWQPIEWQTFNLAYTFMELNLTAKDNLTLTDYSVLEGVDPNHQISLRSMTRLSDQLTFDWWLRYVDELPTINVDNYLTLDVRFAWKIVSNLEISLVGRNLLDNHHPEFDIIPAEQIKILPTEVERSAYVKIDWSF